MGSEFRNAGWPETKHHQDLQGCSSTVDTKYHTKCPAGPYPSVAPVHWDLSFYSNTVRSCTKFSINLNV